LEHFSSYNFWVHYKPAYFICSCIGNKVLWLMMLIVVVEAVHSKMERTGLPARKATIQTMSEISGVIVSITLVMAAVFVPVSFMQGPAGVFYQAICYYTCNSYWYFSYQCVNA
jgi:hypothetical protein